jgi:hypothetical protein
MTQPNLGTLPQSQDLEPPREEADITAEEKGEKGSGKRESFVIRIPSSESDLLTGERKSDTTSEKMTRDKFEDTETDQDVKQKGNTHWEKHFLITLQEMKVNTINCAALSCKKNFYLQTSIKFDGFSSLLIIVNIVENEPLGNY